MRPDLDRMLLRKTHRRAHGRRVGRVKAAGNVGQIDVRHHRRVVTDAVQAKTFAHVAIDRQSHVPNLTPHLDPFSSNSSVGRAEFS